MGESSRILRRLGKTSRLIEFKDFDFNTLKVFDIVSYHSQPGVNWSGGGVGQKVRDGKQINRGSRITLNISRNATADIAGVIVTDKKGKVFCRSIIDHIYNPRVSYVLIFRIDPCFCSSTVTCLDTS